MKKALMGSCVFVALLAGAFAPAQERGLTKSQVVNILRALNTAEWSFSYVNKRFASVDELLPFMRDRGYMKNSLIELSAENLKPYELVITTTPDGQHYQIHLVRPSNMDDEGTWCKPAGFTDDRGVIFLGLAIGCGETEKPSAP